MPRGNEDWFSGWNFNRELRGYLSKNVLVLQDNVPAHISQLVMQTVNDLTFKYSTPLTEKSPKSPSAEEVVKAVKAWFAEPKMSKSVWRRCKLLKPRYYQEWYFGLV